MSEPDTQSPTAAPERVCGFCVATTFGSFFLLFLTGLAFPNDLEATGLDYVFLAVFTAWLGLITAGGIGICLRRSWGERLLNSVVSVTAMCLFTWMALSICWEAWERIAGEAPAEPGDGALLILALLWVGSVALFSWRERAPQGHRRLGPVMILWPLLLLLLEPAAFGVLFLPLVLLVLVGDLLGSRFGHAYLGATIGLICAVALFAALARLSRRWD